MGLRHGGSEDPLSLEEVQALGQTEGRKGAGCWVSLQRYALFRRSDGFGWPVIQAIMSILP